MIVPVGISGPFSWLYGIFLTSHNESGYVKPTAFHGPLLSRRLGIVDIMRPRPFDPDAA